MRGAVPAAVLGLGAALAGCRAAAPRPPNILFITLDTVRADHLSAYGYNRPTTPTLDALARDGVRFDAAYSPTPSTQPAHATLFTGLYPRSHGVVRNGLMLSAGDVTFPEVLREAGYHTAAVISSYVLNSRFGFRQGFASYDEQLDAASEKVSLDEWEGLPVHGGFDRRGDRSTDVALAWLMHRKRDRPFLLWVHYFDPHFPYDPPPEVAARFLAGTDPAGQSHALYDAEIAFADGQVRRLLDELDAEGATADTVVVVVGDHGEGLMQHGYMWHGLQLYEEAVRVPLLIRWPGHIPAGQHLQAPVEMVDVAPTLLDLAKVAPGAMRLQGRSLAPRLLAPRRPGPRPESPRDVERPVYLQRRPYQTSQVNGFPVKGKKFAVRVGRWKYLEAQEEATRELYDLAADPGETHNLAESDGADVSRLSRIIAAWRAALPSTRSTEDQSPRSREILRSLGYLP